MTSDFTPRHPKPPPAGHHLGDPEAMQNIDTVQRRLTAREASLEKARARLAAATPGSAAHRRATLDVEQLGRAVHARRKHLQQLLAAEDRQAPGPG
uniref:hypothetical protein n=1 Tax=Streptomyces sp. W75 TaxID=1170711 RepID=UPI001866AD0D|nr:hypothetical protein [Streptomyces sp. W75]